MEQKPLPDDFKDFIKCLNSNNVRYLLIGGWAVGLHGSPRATKDIDFLVAIDNENLERLQKALLDFNAPPFNIKSFGKSGSVIRMGRSPIQIDIINKADGIDMEDVYPRKTLMNVDGLDIQVVSKDDLITNKRASGREQDTADAAKLEKHKKKKNKQSAP